MCDNCEHEQLAFDATHTKVHTVVRVSKRDEERALSTEERLRLVEAELAKMRQVIASLTGKSSELSRGEPTADAEGDTHHAAAVEG